MFNNFAVEVFDASPTDVGIIQAAREIPGLLAFGVGALALHLTESKIASLSIITIGLGLIFCGLSPSLLMLGLATVLMSFGFHYFEPTNSSQLLMLTKPEHLGKAQGRLRSYESIAGLTGAGLVLVLTLIISFRETFYLIGLGVLLVGIYLTVALPSNRGVSDKRRIRIKKKYWLYYTLSFLRGCRRHIFTTFALFLLVKNHNLSITYISIIILINNFISIFTNRFLGRMSDRLGERTLLAGSSLLLVFIFSGYAVVTYLPLLIIFYLLDNVLFASSVALRSYLSKISDSEDLTGCLSFGMTANHITAIIIPVTGGIVWSMFGYQVTFIAGAAIVFIDMLFSLKIPTRIHGRHFKGK
jgi:predicted MFS family arabinose efflux permease